MTDTPRNGRPLSPHLQIYRFHLTMMVSILHRITGVGLGIVALLVGWWFIALAVSDSQFALADGLLTSWIGHLVLIGGLWAFWHHFLNGIRHLFWDKGLFLELPAAEMGARIVVAGAPALTVLTLVVIAIG